MLASRLAKWLATGIVAGVFTSLIVVLAIELWFREFEINFYGQDVTVTRNGIPDRFEGVRKRAWPSCTGDVFFVLVATSKPGRCEYVVARYNDEDSAKWGGFDLISPRGGESIA
jgi:hypothetical protein